MIPDRVRETFSSLYDKARRYLYPVVLLGGLIFCLLWSVTPVRDFLKKLKLMDDASIFGVVGVIVTIVIFELQQHEKISKRIGDILALFSPAQNSQIEFGGVGQVYGKFNPVVKKMIEESRTSTRIDVLGLTLYSAWPVALEPQIQNGDLRNCVINVYLISTEFVKKNRELFRDDWEREVTAKPQEIAVFVRDHEVFMKERNIVVKVKSYNFFPGVHGFRTSDGHLMLSFVHWSKQQKTVDNPNQFYEIFPPADTSSRAKAYRDLFENWVNRAERD
jgi:hypothetical protein